MDYEKQIHQIIKLVPEGIELAPETPAIAAAALEAVDRRYGPDSERPLSFHNAPHSVGVARRNVRMSNILLPYVRDGYKPYFYDLGILGGTGHDYDQDSGPGANEDNSTDYIVEEIEAADGVLNTDTFKKRMGLGIDATKVEMQEDGSLVQTSLQKGSHDPIKFSMAFSDINGIAMEGSKRMWRDATNLYYEITPEPTVEGHANFLISQAGFLRQRLNDPRVKADIAYYFPDNINAVYGDMRKAFHANITSAYRLAVLIGERPELMHVIETTAKTIDSTRVGGIIGKLLTKKIAADQ